MPDTKSADPVAAVAKPPPQVFSPAPPSAFPVVSSVAAVLAAPRSGLEPDRGSVRHGVTARDHRLVEPSGRSDHAAQVVDSAAGGGR
jgi:hypothetical protein